MPQLHTTTRTIKNLTPSVRLFGDWAKAHRLLNTIDSAILIGSQNARASIAKKLLAKVRKNIRENGGSIGWVAVSPDYAKYKIKKGGDPMNLLFLTGTYYRNIKIWNKGNKTYVGVKRGIRNKLTGGNITVGQIARIMEYGSSVRNIPARPLWGPSFQQIGGNRRVKSMMLWHIRRQIYVQYGVRAKVTII